MLRTASFVLAVAVLLGGQVRADPDMAQQMQQLMQQMEGKHHMGAQKQMPQIPSPVNIELSYYFGGDGGMGGMGGKGGMGGEGDKDGMGADPAMLLHALMHQLMGGDGGDGGMMLPEDCNEHSERDDDEDDEMANLVKFVIAMKVDGSKMDNASKIENGLDYLGMKFYMLVAFMEKNNEKFMKAARCPPADEMHTVMMEREVEEAKKELMEKRMMEGKNDSFSLAVLHLKVAEVKTTAFLRLLLKSHEDCVAVLKMKGQMSGEDEYGHFVRGLMGSGTKEHMVGEMMKAMMEGKLDQDKKEMLQAMLEGKMEGNMSMNATKALVKFHLMVLDVKITKLMLYFQKVKIQLKTAHQIGCAIKMNLMSQVSGMMGGGMADGGMMEMMKKHSMMHGMMKPESMEERRLKQVEEKLMAITEYLQKNGQD